MSNIYQMQQSNSKDIQPLSSGSNVHFAAYPPALIRDCVLAGCPVGGIILDPFMGTGTTAMVALQYQRHYVGFELNPEYFPIIKQKIQVTPNMFV